MCYPSQLDGIVEIDASVDVETTILMLRDIYISTNPIHKSTASRAGLYGAPKSDRAAGSEAPNRVLTPPGHVFVGCSTPPGASETKH